MKRTLVAILALSPVLAVAQSKVPAQPVSTPVLEARLNVPTGFAADNKPETRVSTGVTAPELVSTAPIASTAALPMPAITEDKVVVVSMIVDASGEPTNLAVVQSGGMRVDANVLAAVSRYHFKPGTLNGLPTAVPVNLSVKLSAQQND